MSEFERDSERAADAAKTRRMPELAPPKDLWSSFERFTTSGLFFMLVGGSILFISYSTMGTAHSSLSLILVVTGVAILLYGTGTQGIGQFSNNGYKVAVAGGAGVLALCIGYGVVTMQEQIKSAFQIQKKYLRIVIKPDEQDGITGLIFGNYIPIASFDTGEEIPAVRRGRSVEAYISYLELSGADRVLEVAFYQDPTLEPTRKRLGKPLEKIRVPIKMTKELQEVADAGLDFPRYRLPATVALKAPQIDIAQAQNADRHQDRNPRLTQPDSFNLLAGEQQ